MGSKAHRAKEETSFSTERALEPPNQGWIKTKPTLYWFMGQPRNWGIQQDFTAPLSPGICEILHSVIQTLIRH